jgi:hypothetical protein
MMGSLVRVVLGALWIAAVAASPALGELQPDRQDVYEIGAPLPISRQVLKQEMLRNSELAQYIGTYGYPDYAEVQEVRPQWPWAAYEVRIYYLRREMQLSFARVNVAPSVTDYGLERYAGPIDRATLDRLLTAAPPAEAAAAVQ